MKLLRTTIGAALLAGLSLTTNCGGKNEFTVEGHLTGATDSPILLERMDANAGWVVMESVEPDADGRFAFSAKAPEHPELYRLNYNDKYVYLPVDSLEHFSLTANAADISSGFKLCGSPQAEELTAFEAEALKVERYANNDSIAAFRKRVFNRYLKDGRGNILSYYILTKRIGENYLIDYTDPLYWAVATSFETYKPEDPHTKLLTERAMQGQSMARKQRGKANTKVIEATQTAMIEVRLPGLDGKEAALSSLLGKGKPVILAFGGMTIPDAPIINMELRKIYDSGKADIYQVCLDQDQFQWSQSAKALPWTVVYDPDGLRSRHAANYNLASIPAYFIYNASGELVNSTGDVKAIHDMLH